MSDERREECRCGHDKTSHHEVKERVDEPGGRVSFAKTRAACLASFCDCDRYEPRS